MKKVFSVVFVLMFVIAQLGFGQIWVPIKRVLSRSVVPYTTTAIAPVQKVVVIPMRSTEVPVTVTPTTKK